MEHILSGRQYPENFDLEANLKTPNNSRIHYICKAFEQGVTVDEIHELTKIDKWFLQKLRRIITLADAVRVTDKGEKMAAMDKELLTLCKSAGFSDKTLGQLMDSNELDMRALRQSFGLRPVVKQIDTMAAEYPTSTNYLYMTYNGTENDLDFNVSFKFK